MEQMLAQPPEAFDTEGSPEQQVFLGAWQAAQQ